ncbi:MAG: glycosyltransferase family 2 protein [Cytophagales bacterium]|jgi:biofilm PGA synthesis N-glycosyltransferase PgaC|nr:glycosyltransferase family 2 protein [Cytophagales bacterium]MCA6369450.1 glycosyltransferase family 2 protein [Cytophagales bacterium]MCA6373178.1 glycosyltransferase family 2 protein [Cytophagales bacterium]MCA6376395.1 glycosyltransferase family 2 protein [Cytophagales bacterium]MCA6383586.1 glycosyltransferase family 2 protein [Cytophagales bacterium]
MNDEKIALVVACYNEESILTEKVKNCLALNYPKEKLDIVFVTDGSTDGSTDMLMQYPRLTVFHEPKRAGKRVAIERIMPMIDAPIIVLTDANSMLNSEALNEIVKHYHDPKVGAVAGEKKVMAMGAGVGEGFYWRYESFLKKVDSHLFSVVGAAGELFSFRKELFVPLPSQTIIEDFALSLSIVERGFKVVYEPNAWAEEKPSSNMAEEWKRKVRICAGGFREIVSYARLFNVIKYPWLSYLLISHRVLRWAVVPFILPLLFVVTYFLANNDKMFQLFFALQIMTYLLALVGVGLRHQTKLPFFIGIPFQFAMMNAAAYVGLVHYLRGVDHGVWKKIKRVE